jgi:hypothetical protein
MKRLLASAVVVGLGLAVVLTTTTEAAAKGPGRSVRTVRTYPSTTQSNVKHHPTSLYLNRGFNNWSSWCWNSRSRCYFYWYPTGRCYYYWYAPACCYYPISCINEYPPTAVQYQTPTPGAAPLPVQIQVTSINQNGQNGVLPSVSGPVPPPGR